MVTSMFAPLDVQTDQEFDAYVKRAYYFV